MNLFSIFTELFKTLWWLLPLVFVLALAQTPWFKGFLGELLVRFAIKLKLNKDEYQALHNVTLRTLDGTTQIDHVLISKFGIFSIETKNYSGWIFGGQYQKVWTQKLFKKTFKFQNPLHQNFKHLKALEALLSVPQDKIHSVIVFVGGSTFKTEMPPNVRTVTDFIQYIESKNTQVFSMEEVVAIKNKLLGGRMTPNLATNKEHVANLQKRKDPNSERKCPRCGSRVISRCPVTRTKPDNSALTTSQAR